ncbi:unnamed protein product [Sphagnum troendelagicum]
MPIDGDATEGVVGQVERHVATVVPDKAMGVDEVTTLDPINDVQIGIKELGAKVLLEGDVHLIMVVHKNVVKLGEAHVGQRPIVEVATLPFLDKGKGFHFQA